MKTHQKNGFEYFYDRNQKLWILYPVDEKGMRIEWDIYGTPIEVEYFNNKEELLSNIKLKSLQNEEAAI